MKIIGKQSFREKATSRKSFIKRTLRRDTKSDDKQKVSARIIAKLVTGDAKNRN